MATQERFGKVRSALVIGGGIAGPVTAMALRKAGIEATVYEAYATPADAVGGTLALAPNGLNALAIFGCDRGVHDASLPITSTVMAIGNSRVALPVLQDLPPLQMIHRRDLHRVLRERAIAGGVPFEWNKQLTGVTEDDGGITASFADGSTATADILVGADGVRSTVRRLIDPDAPDATYTGLLSLEGPADIDPRVAPGTMNFAFGARAYYIYWALPKGGAWWGVNLPSDQYLSLTQAREIPVETWLQTLRETFAGDDPGERLAESMTAETIQVNGAVHIMPPVPHWYRGRMVLVGDSVHAPSNSTGQGASLAIESSIELALCLRDAPDAATAFALYEARRRPRVEKIARRGASINRTKVPGPMGRRVMPLMMRAAFRLMPLERTVGPEQRYTIDWEKRLPVEKGLSAVGR